LHAVLFARGWTPQTILDLLHNAHGLMLPNAFILWQEAGDVADIISIGVHPSQQRRGLASQLLKGMEAKTPACEIFLEVSKANASAIAFYQHHGFAAVGTRPNYYPHLTDAARDALTMRKG
jgi:[ribosomal protein S18]-alanine N-acetyltransferase